jgi:hypothetical protein
VLLLALNLLEFDRPLGPDRDRGLPAEPKEQPSPAETSVGRGGASTGAAAAPDANTKQTPATGGSAGGSLATTSETSGELERLRSAVAELQRSHDAIRAEYNALLERVANLGVVERELNRLTTMELVDVGSYARGVRKGLVNVGRGVLTEPGVVIDTTTEPPATGTTQAAPKPAYAWSVFDEKEHRGYLNLYHLPALSDDQSMHIWVRPADANEYQRAGEVPRQLQGGSGSVQYVLPATTATPGEILITIEPRNTTPAMPAGPTVLRGP